MVDLFSSSSHRCLCPQGFFPLVFLDLCSYGLCSGRDLADHREIGVVSPPPLDVRCSTDGMLCSFCWHCELA